MWSMASDGERVLKGSHIGIAAEWIDGRLGEGSAAQISKEYGGDWGVILPIARYDADVLLQVFADVSRRTGVGVEDISAEVARTNALRDLRGLYKTFLRVAQPVRVLSYTPRLWRTYVNFADATAISNERGHYLGEGSGLEQRDVDWACGCWRGFIPTAISLAGGSNVQAKIVSRERQSDGMFTIRLECTYM